MHVNRQTGFSLLEVLVAFVILALSLGVIMRLFSGSLQNIAKAERSAQAVAVAQAALAGLGVESPLSEGEQTGEAAGGYRWRAQVSRHADAAPPVLENPNAPWLYRVDLAVTKDENAAPVLELTSMRVGPKP